MRLSLEKNQEVQIEKFREYLIDNERSKNTIDSYIRSVAMYFERYDDLSKANMIDFKKWQLDQWTPKTAHNRVVALNQFCIFLGKNECCIKGIKMQQSSSVENVISLEEYNKLISGLKEDGNTKGYWMIAYLAKTGARVSEFIRIPKKSLDIGYAEMWTKGKIRRIYIPQNLINESKDFFVDNKSEYLFENRFGNMYSERGIAQNIKNWAKKYGVREEVAHPHAFRHLYAIEFLKNNPNISLLADLMGHSSVNTTSIYLKLSKEEQMKQFNEASNW